jgi:hypothetical protein
VKRYPSRNGQPKCETPRCIIAQYWIGTVVQQKFMTPHSLCQSLSGLSLALSMSLDAGGLFALGPKLGNFLTEVRGHQSFARGARHFPPRCQAFFPAIDPITPFSFDISSCMSTEISSFIVPEGLASTTLAFRKES